MYTLKLFFFFAFFSSFQLVHRELTMTQGGLTVQVYNLFSFYYELIQKRVVKYFVVIFSLFRVCAWRFTRDRSLVYDQFEDHCVDRFLNSIAGFQCQAIQNRSKSKSKPFNR